MSAAMDSLTINEQNQIKKSYKSCIFISYKSQDKNWAIEVGKYIKDIYKIDIYLDITDSGLQSAAERGDDKEIVKHIQNALSMSTHLMCLVSNATQTSWWVPYEVGYAKKSDKKISTLKYKDILDVPSFLKVEDVIRGSKQLNVYLSTITRDKVFDEMKSYNRHGYNLNNYLDWI